MTTTTSNGSARKTLASQLDRLDAILDALSDGLNEAVAGAVQGAVETVVRQAVGQAVKDAVQAVLCEVLTNPDLHALLRAAVPASPETTSPPDPPQGLFRRACGWAKAGVGVAATAGAYVVGQAAGVKPAARAAWRLAARFKGRVLAACGIGVAAGVVTYWAGPWLGVAAAWAGGFVATLAVQARNALRRLLAPVAAWA